MQFDPARRMARYQKLLEQLESAGCIVKVHLEPNRVDSMVVRKFHDYDRSLIVYQRKRGVYLSESSKIPSGIFRVDAGLEAVINQYLDPSELFDGFANTRGVTNVPVSEWHQAERKEKLEGWEDYGWQLLPESSVARLGDLYDKKLWVDGTLTFPKPHMAWKMKTEDAFLGSSRSDLEAELHIKALRAFKNSVPIGQRLYAFDWQHPCFSMRPHRVKDEPFRDYWAMTLTPDGDDKLFLTESFEMGMFSLRDNTFHVFGSPSSTNS